MCSSPLCWCTTTGSGIADISRGPRPHSYAVPLLFIILHCIQATVHWIDGRTVVDHVQNWPKEAGMENIQGSRPARVLTSMPDDDDTPHPHERCVNMTMDCISVYIASLLVMTAILLAIIISYDSLLKSNLKVCYFFYYYHHHAVLLHHKYTTCNYGTITSSTMIRLEKLILQSCRSHEQE